MEDLDAGEFRSPKFIKKHDLRMGGSRAVKVVTVETRDGFPDAKTGKPKRELVLVFDDQSKFGLGAQTNLDTLIDLFGRRTSGWVGRTITLVFDPAVANPKNAADPGGIRILRPDTYDEEEPFVSDLEDAEEEPLPPVPPPPKSNGPVSRGRRQGR
jgi:hypothetical protein